MNDPPKDWSAADGEQWRDVVEGYAPRALSDRERHRPDLTEAEYNRLLEQRRAAPSRNPLLPPAPGEIDPLPPYLRAAIAELKEVLAPMDKETRRWYIKEGCRHAAKALAEGKALPDTERQWLAEALAAIGDGHSPQTAFFGQLKPGPPPRATNNLIRRLVRLVWHDKKQRIRPEYAAAGYSFVTEGKPPWITAKQAVAFKWVGEAVGLEADEVRKRYREQAERYTPAAPLPWEDRAIESNGAATRNSARPARPRPADFAQERATPRHHRSDEPSAAPGDAAPGPPSVDTGLVSTDEHAARADDRLAAAQPVDVELATRAARIVVFLRKTGRPAFRAEVLSDCFGRNLKAADLDAALAWAQMQTPPWVEVRKVPKRGARSSQTAVEVRLPQTPHEGDEPDEGEAATRSRSHSFGYECDEGDGTEPPLGARFSPSAPRERGNGSPKRDEKPIRDQFSRLCTDAPIGYAEPMEETNISERAALARINRKLAKEGLRCNRARGKRARERLGAAYVWNTQTREIVTRNVTVEAIARSLGVLAEGEQVRD